MPTFPGVALMLFIAGLFVFCVFLRVYPFLSQTRPLPSAELAVVEGWMADAELRDVAVRLQPDQLIVISGGPISYGQQILQYKTYAEVGAARLAEMGIATNRILIASAPETDRDRTFVSAQTVRRVLEANELFGKSIQLYTTGAHSRRSLLLFKRVFGRDYPLGVVSIAPPHYHLERWYLYSEGVRHVISEALAWIYARFFMLPHG